MKSVLLGVAATLLAATVVSTVARADTFTAFDYGSYTNAGAHTASNTNIIAGGINSNRNFFAFNLAAAVGNTVVSAFLFIPGDFGTMHSLGGGGVGPETFDLFDYLLPVSNLVAGTAGVAGYADLGTGTTFGQSVITAPFDGANDMPPVTITLNAAALGFLNALLGGLGPYDFAIGGVCSTCTGEFLWGTSSANPAAQLTLEFAEVSEVPLPAALPLFAGGLGVMGLLAHRRKRKQAIA